jgi:DNA modification methylase
VIRVIVGDVREKLAELPEESVHCVVTSPPYFGLRDYGVVGQIGLEPTPAEFVQVMVEVFREVRRVLRKDGTCWINLGDSYASAPSGSFDKGQRGGGALEGGGFRANKIIDATKLGYKPKDLMGMPWRVAFALQADGWYLRQDIIWSKPNPMPESVTDRCTKAHEYLFLLSKSARYFYDQEAIREDWTSGRDDMRENGVRTGTAYLQQGPVASNSVKSKKPDGWDTGAGGHGTVHRAGREKGEAAEIDPSKGRNRRSVWTVATQPFSDWTPTVQRVRVAADAPDDGKKRTTSPDCPVHGDRAGLSATVPDDEHAAAPLPHSGGRIDLFQVQAVGSVPTDPHPEAETALQNSDLLDQSCAPSAKPHSKRSRKTGRVHETSLSCMPCAETSPRTDDTSAPHGLSDLADRMPESNTVQGELVDSPSNQTACGSVRTPDEQALSLASGLSQCTCEWYVEKTSKTSHFATFPPDLIEPCIKAGCPKGGTVLDPFGGAGTTGLVADRLQRDAILIELNPAYAAMMTERIVDDGPLFAEVAG